MREGLPARPLFCASETSPNPAINTLPETPNQRPDFGTNTGVPRDTGTQKQGGLSPYNYL